MDGQQGTMTTTNVRLRPTTSSRDMEGRGVAISAGGSAVVINGVHGVTLWRAVEPHLRRGVDPAGFVATLPASARSTVQSLMGELEDHGLLVRDELEDDAAAAHPAIDYLRRVCRAPVAAARRTASTSLTISGATGDLADALRVQLAVCGFASVTFEPGADALGQSPIAMIRASDGLGQRTVVLIGACGGFCAVGPVEGADADHTEVVFRRWAIDAPSSIGPNWAALVAGQAALAALRAMDVTSDASPTMTPGNTYVTSTAELVAEPRQFTMFSDNAEPETLSVDDLALVPGTETSVPDTLASMEALWDPVFGVVSGAVPGALPQQPVGLARSGDGRVIGVGGSTAEARLAAVAEELTRVWRSTVRTPGPIGELGVGPTTTDAAAAAFVALLDADEAARTDAGATSGAVAVTGTARWLASAAVLILGREVSVESTWLAGRWSGIVRVIADLGDGACGVAYGLSEQGAAEGALLRAVGRAQSGDTARSAPLDTHSVRNRALLRWPGLDDAVRFTRLHADGWDQHGALAVSAEVTS